MRGPRRWRSILVPLTASAKLPAQVAVTTHHSDLNRTGAYLNEMLLNTSNVSVRVNSSSYELD
jgi:hypothetical protein